MTDDLVRDVKFLTLIARAEKLADRLEQTTAELRKVVRAMPERGNDDDAE